MLDRTTITAMDTLLWLQSGEDTAELLHLSASSVSRKANNCASALDLALLHQNNRWQLHGHSPLLDLERQLLQDYRLAGRSPLRLDCCFETRPLLAEATAVASSPSRLQRVDAVVPPQPQIQPQAAYELLEDRLIDAYVGTLAPDLPEADRPLVAIPLLELPMRILAAADHPLHPSRHIGLRERMAYPSPAIAPAWALPRRERLLRQEALGRDPLPSGRDIKELLRSQVLESGALLPGTALMATALPGIRPLAEPLNLRTALMLVVHRELERHPRLQALADQLRELYGDQLLRQGETLVRC